MNNDSLLINNVNNVKVNALQSYKIFYNFVLIFLIKICSCSSRFSWLSNEYSRYCIILIWNIKSTWIQNIQENCYMLIHLTGILRSKLCFCFIAKFHKLLANINVFSWPKSDPITIRWNRSKANWDCKRKWLLSPKYFKLTNICSTRCVHILFISAMNLGSDP